MTIASFDSIPFICMALTSMWSAAPVTRPTTLTTPLFGTSWVLVQLGMRSRFVSLPIILARGSYTATLTGTWTCQSLFSRCLSDHTYRSRYCSGFAVVFAVDVPDVPSQDKPPGTLLLPRSPSSLIETWLVCLAAWDQLCPAYNSFIHPG